jgi:glycosyltransferase involved in cell wall biosynthesis
MPEERIACGYNVVDNQFFGKTINGECQEQGDLTTEDTESTELEAGACLSGQAGDAFSNPCASGLARDSETPSHTRFADGPAPSRDARRSLPATVPEALASPYFLASNRFVERKNLGRLVEGYKIFQDSALQIQVEKMGLWPLVLLGDGELRGDLEARCAELGLRIATGFSNEGAGSTEGQNLKLNSYKLKTPTGGGCVVFPGFRQIGELQAFYAGAGAFVHPALEEPWGLVINEAMASGLPVLSSRNVGAAEELVVDGKTGFLFDPRDVNSIAESLFKMFSMSEPARRKMGVEARQMLERKAPSRAFGEGLAKVLGI